MGMNAAILEARRKVLGASETPAVLGFGAYAGQTPDAVYWKKVGPVVESGTDATQMGNDFEPAIIQWAQRQVGVDFCTDPSECFQVMLDGIGKGILAATPDGIFESKMKRWGVEAKAVMYGNPGIDAWGEPGTDKVPDHVIIQTQQQMAVWGLDVVWVPVLWCVGFRPEFRLYRVERDADLFDGMIAPKAVQWWNEHVVTQIPPGDEPPSLEVIKAMQRKEGLFVPADQETFELIASWDTCRKVKNAAERQDDGMLREILSHMERYWCASCQMALHDVGEEPERPCPVCGRACRKVNAEGLLLPDGRTFKYAEQNGARRCDLDALEQKHPDIYKELVTQSKHRTPRIVGKAKVVAA